MNIHRWSVFIATLGPIGHYAASGAIATLITMPFVFWFHTLFCTQWLYLGVVAAMFTVGVFVVSHALRQFKRHDDPHEIVLDEVVGCFLLFWGITLSAQSMVVGFLLIRMFDIIKFTWFKKSETFVSAWGIMGDDIVAALLANLALRFLF